ncbi:cAMP-activated global transcriptional regulator CRP [Variibacter gotjawalensis]|uniref:cAMP-activated global transcriptional regulator CRP n=1 Tax=Variibacter gotjawalensis TaxID=1333996 RepID=A0A0S3PVL6_9BRAD|nr:Crp/Fnr family transcriptional regulator [Variibacter gotjawalensis]NIK45783.1 CRP-like cAMP-binding protein [Variibacter gotjawalensis]RZS47707.1 CRP-like cAMP-binding protein [Variibacter gotjawalensis]BAT59960.1 cAMP-activated global transcriptional regulator CRP [Variibacter gotjawalensis]
MITAEHFRRIAYWSRDLEHGEFERARAGIIEKTYQRGAYICHRGDEMEHWTGLVSGLVKVSTASLSGKSVSLAGMRACGWFGEGSVLKGEARQYDLVALRDTRLALMNRATFLWLFDNSVAFNRFLVWQLNARLGQFIALVEYDRSLEGKARLARTIAWLFHPTLYPDAGAKLDITQEEIGLLSGLSRQVTNKSVAELQDEKLIEADRESITVRDLDALRRYGE